MFMKPALAFEADLKAPFGLPPQNYCSVFLPKWYFPLQDMNHLPKPRYNVFVCPERSAWPVFFISCCRLYNWHTQSISYKVGGIHSWQKPATAITSLRLFQPEVIPAALTRIEVPNSKTYHFCPHFKICQFMYRHTHTRSLNVATFFQIILLKKLHQKESCYCWKNLRSIIMDAQEFYLTETV